MIWRKGYTAPNGTEFDLQAEDLTDLEIRESRAASKFYYFYHLRRRTLIKSFVLRRTQRTKYLCTVTLIRNERGRFEPRFEFSIRDTAQSTIESIQLPVETGETRTVKARVDLKDAHEEFGLLVGFLDEQDEIDLVDTRLRLVPGDQADLAKLVKTAPRDKALAVIRASLSGGITDSDVALLTDRKASLSEFERLFSDPGYFERARAGLGSNKGEEDVWQDFFERNEWIFGYGLKLISCEGLDDKKLETIVTGSGLMGGSGKRIDALMKTRGRISSLLFTEIKTHTSRLTALAEYRPGVYVPDKHLRGAVAQVQKTIHKVTLAASQNHHDITTTGGNPSGETVTVVRPRGVVVVGSLDEFEEQHGPNYERFASFELYRNSLAGIEVLTFDELLERARYIVELYS